MFEYKTDIDQLAGLFRCTGTLSLPEITLVRHQHDRAALRYEIIRAFSDLVEQIIDKEFELNERS